MCYRPGPVAPPSVHGGHRIPVPVQPMPEWCMAYPEDRGGLCVCVCVYVTKHITHITQIRPRAQKPIEPTYKKCIRVDTREKTQYPNYRKRGSTLGREMVRRKSGEGTTTKHSAKRKQTLEFLTFPKKQGENTPTKRNPDL